MLEGLLYSVHLTHAMLAISMANAAKIVRVMTAVTAVIKRSAIITTTILMEGAAHRLSTKARVDK